MATKKKVMQLRTPSPAHEKLDIQIGRLRELAGDGEKSQVSLMLLLLEVYEYKEIWQSRYSTWDEFLSEEGFATPHTFMGFQKALAEFGQADIQRLGVRAATALVRLPKPTRVKVLATVNEWMKTHPVAPTYQRVSSYTKLIIGVRSKAHKGSKDEQMVQLQKQNTELTKRAKFLTDHNKTLVTHIFKVHGVLKRNKIVGPKIPNLDV